MRINEYMNRIKKLPLGKPNLLKIEDTGKTSEDLCTLVDILTKQNKIMKDILRYQGVHDLEKIFYDCPLPYDEDLSTPGGYNAPSNPKKIIEDNKRAVDDFVNYIGPLGSSVERRKQNERDSDKS